MLQVYYRKNKLQSENNQTVPTHQFKRGKPEI